MTSSRQWSNLSLSSSVELGEAMVSRGQLSVQSGCDEWLTLWHRWEQHVVHCIAHCRHSSQYACHVAGYIWMNENLFRSSRYNPERVLHRLLLHPNNTGYNLRQRAHNLTLPSDVNSTTKQNFIFRMLFDAMCWLLNSIISHVLYFVYFLWVSLNFYLLHTALVICALKNYLLTLWPFCDLEKSFIVCSREETDHRGGQTVYANR